MTKAIRIHKSGGPEELSWDTVDVSDPGPGEARIRQTAVGLNYIDVYHRTGLYPIGTLPQIIGTEAAGIVEAIGKDVSEITVGDRVAYSPVLGAYAETRLINSAKLIKMPENIDDQTAAAMMLKGMTAAYLLHRTYPVKAGEPILIMAAAGGVGQILSQWANHLGAVVIGCVGSEEKAEIAQSCGCHHTILYNAEDVPARVKEITGGEGAAVSYDGVGLATYMASLDSLRPFGYMVSFGNASGSIITVESNDLASRGGLFYTRPSLMPHTATRLMLEDLASSLIEAVGNGHVKISINQTYALSEAKRAHHDLETRKTTGSSVLIP
ncbi:MAG: quinone oxidoreductase [Magnetovibrio sp.]|nr:quinone oxidoreductase [Magnetovibrio sp.]|tara:strand:+ start:3242 stop:4216 length:975 start_codon:yes stop_codon:yes gene_type:complete